MYRKYRQHPELNRLIGAAAVSKQFRQTLLQNPKQILEHGYLGYQFDLTAEEAALVSGTVARDIHEFSRQLWEWMGRNGNGKNRGNGHQPPDETHTLLSPEEGLTSVPGSTVPMSAEKEELPTRSFPSDSTLAPWKDANMDPLILVVDDNREMARGLQFALETEGFQVALAWDGESALKFLDHEQPSLILADIKMPRMDGYALLRTVKRNAQWRDIPFVFVTAAADWREAVMAKSMGADEYVIKPFELEDLIEIVRQFTDRVEEAETNRTGQEQEREANP